MWLLEPSLQFFITLKITCCMANVTYQHKTVFSKTFKFNRGNGKTVYGRKSSIALKAKSMKLSRASLH